MKISPAQLRRMIIQETRKVLREADESHPPTERQAPETVRSLDDAMKAYFGLLNALEAASSLKVDPTKAFKDAADASEDQEEKAAFEKMAKEYKNAMKVAAKLKDNLELEPKTLRGIAPQGPGGQHPPEEAPPTQRGGAHGFGPVKHNPANESYRRYARNRTWFGR